MKSSLKNCQKVVKTNQFCLFFRQNESTTSLRNDSGYTPTPCNNLTSIDHSKNNLLVNVPTKTDIEKNNINNKTSSASTVIHNGTLPKNGTLCKKVYL